MKNGRERAFHRGEFVAQDVTYAQCCLRCRSAVSLVCTVCLAAICHKPWFATLTVSTMLYSDSLLSNPIQEAATFATQHLLQPVLKGAAQLFFCFVD